jgi:hypothetical protein
MKTCTRSLFAAAIVAASALGSAAHAGNLDCKLSFTMSGWSAFYKRSSGEGHVTCSNGTSMNVSLEARGGGLTAGKSTIRHGEGVFSGVTTIDEILGKYASAEASAGAVKASKAQVVTKGEVSLALSGTGDGWDLGVAFGKFTIKRR